MLQMAGATQVYIFFTFSSIKQKEKQRVGCARCGEQRRNLVGPTNQESTLKIKVEVRRPEGAVRKNTGWASKDKLRSLV